MSHVMFEKSAATRQVRKRVVLLLFSLSALVIGSPLTRADDAEIGKILKEKGVTVTESKGVVTALAIKDGSRLTDADF